MRGANGNENAGFADFQPAQAVDHCDAVNRIFFVELPADFAHFRESHRFIRFVIKVKRAPIVRLVADETVERYDGAVAGGANVPDECGWINRLAD